MRVPHKLRTVLALVIGVALAALTPAAAHAAGPISQADRDFIATVHASASFATSASRLAQTSAGAAAVRTIGRTILEQDTQLDGLARTAATTTTTMAAQLPLVESTGLVDFAALPTPTPTATARTGPYADPDMLAGARHRDGFLWPSVRVNVAVLGSAVLISAIAMRRVFWRSRTRPRR